jgi:hypothetical protein
MTATAILGFVRSISASYLDAKVLSPAELADPVVTLVLRMVGARADHRLKSPPARAAESRGVRPAPVGDARTTLRDPGRPRRRAASITGTAG